MNKLKQKEVMNTKTTIELYNATQNYLAELEKQLMNSVHEAMANAAEELGVHPYEFDAIYDYMRAPFGHKPNAVEIINDIMTKAQSDEKEVEFREDVFMGPSHYAKISTEYVKTIAKYL